MAKLVLAMGLSGEHNGLSLRRGPLKILSADSFSCGVKNPKRFSIVTTARVGISSGEDLPLRFYIDGNEFVSRR